MEERGFNEARVTVREGILQGTVENGQKVFRGVPYAAPPIGDRRWKVPQPAQRWFGIRDVDRLVNGALQVDPRPNMPFENFELGARMDAEDCLYLNIWSPAKAPNDKLPVFVWVHGGGMVAGTGMASFFEGEKLAENGIIVVTINYRLGLFGFLCHPQLTAESPNKTSGNYALYDIRQALVWLRENISNFGGDVDNITVGGQSGGSIGVSCMLMSPLVKGLCRRVVMESGCPLMRGMMPPKTLPEMEVDGAHFAESVGCANLDELRAMDGCDLIEATVEKRYTPNYCIDGYFLPDTPGEIFARGEFNDMDVLIGATSEEFGSMGPPSEKAVKPEQFEAYIKGEFPAELHNTMLQHYRHADDREALLALLRLLGDLHFVASARLSEYCAKKGQVSYLYYKTRPDPGEKGETVGATHSSELPYLFGRDEKSLINPAGMDKDEQDFGRQLMSYWVNFISTGNPNGSNVQVQWPRCQALFDYLDLGKEIRLPSEDDKQILFIFDKLLSTGEKQSLREYMETSAYGIPDLLGPLR